MALRLCLLRRLTFSIRGAVRRLRAPTVGALDRCSGRGFTSPHPWVVASASLLCEVLEKMQAEPTPAVIFATAFDRCAIDAFEAHALDYLLKPIDDERLAQAMERVREHRDQAEASRHRDRLYTSSSNTGCPVNSLISIVGPG